MTNKSLCENIWNPHIFAFNLHKNFAHEKKIRKLDFVDQTFWAWSRFDLKKDKENIVVYKNVSQGFIMLWLRKEDFK